MRLRPLPLALTLVLASCQPTSPLEPTPGGVRSPRPGASAGPGEATPTPGATGTARPGQGPGTTLTPNGTGPTPTPGGTAGPTATPAALATLGPPVLLRRPAGAVRVVAGALSIEAGYAVARGAAIVANNGGGILGNYGAKAVAEAGGNIIANNGGGFVWENGGGLVANNGAGIVANNGGGILGNYGAKLAAPAAASYALRQAGPAAGEQLPAAGMLVAAMAPAGRTLLPLGADADGKPVYEAFTDAAGGFTLWLPPAGTPNVIVFAQPPGHGADPRLAYALLAVPDGPKAVFDEDTALVTRFLRRSLVPRLVGALAAADEAGARAGVLSAFSGAPAGLRTTLGDAAAALAAAARASGLAKASPDKLEAAAARVVDVALARAAVRKAGLGDAGALLPGMPAVKDAAAWDVMVDGLGRMRRGAAGKLGEPAFFADQPYMKAANAARAAAGLPAYEVRKAADLGEFLVAEVLTRRDGFAPDDVAAVLASVGADGDLGLELLQITIPSALPTAIPTKLPSAIPTKLPSALPSGLPSALPSLRAPRQSDRLAVAAQALLLAVAAGLADPAARPEALAALGE